MRQSIWAAGGLHESSSFRYICSLLSEFLVIVSVVEITLRKRGLNPNHETDIILDINNIVEEII